MQENKQMTIQIGNKVRQRVKAWTITSAFSQLNTLNKMQIA